LPLGSAVRGEGSKDAADVRRLEVRIIDGEVGDFVVIGFTSAAPGSVAGGGGGWCMYAAGGRISIREDWRGKEKIGAPDIGSMKPFMGGVWDDCWAWKSGETAL
jgi:hypothetical protein